MTAASSGDVDMTANMAAAELQAGVSTNAPSTPPPSQPPGYPPGYGFDDQMPFVPGQGGSAPSTRQADPMAQMVAMLTNIINALPSSIAAAVTASSNHRMANAKLEVKTFERIRLSQTNQKHGKNGVTSSSTSFKSATIALPTSSAASRRRRRRSTV